MKKLILLTFMLLAFSACTPKTPEQAEERPAIAPAAQTSQSAEEKVYGGEISLSMRLPQTLNPILNTETSVDSILSLIFEPLFNISNDFTVTPNIAESYALSADGLSATITLSPSKWSDGTPVTADDFVYTVSAIKNAPEKSIYKANTENIDKCTAIDERTVRVSFRRVYAGMEYNFVFPLIPKHYYEGQSDKDMSPLGNGAYEFASYEAPEKLTLKASEANGKPYIAAVNVLITPEAQNDLYAFDQNITDVLATDFYTWSKYRSSKSVNSVEINTTYFDFIGFNTAKKFADSDLRELVAVSADTDEYITNVYLSHAAKAQVPVNPDSFAYDKTLPEVRFDPERAKTLAKEGTAFNILINEENDERAKIAENIKKNLSNVGVTANIESVPYDAYVSRVNSRDYDAFVGGFYLQPFPDLSFIYHSGGNLFGYGNPEMDAALAAVFTAAGNETLLSSLKDVQSIAQKDMPLYGLCFTKHTLFTSKKIQDVSATSINNIYSNIREWNIK
ncbi:ABC transporter substrate-binding protein [Clostridia bacterium]|nr:ABC transporter substrate-binding protein [Clostridia bacterium]